MHYEYDVRVRRTSTSIYRNIVMLAVYQVCTQQPFEMFLVHRAVEQIHTYGCEAHDR